MRRDRLAPARSQLTRQRAKGVRSVVGAGPCSVCMWSKAMPCQRAKPCGAGTHAGEPVFRPASALSVKRPPPFQAACRHHWLNRHTKKSGISRCLAFAFIRVHSRLIPSVLKVPFRSLPQLPPEHRNERARAVVAELESNRIHALAPRQATQRVQQFPPA
jgi:hypothetical protein